MTALRGLRAALRGKCGGWPLALALILGNAAAPAWAAKLALLVGVSAYPKLGPEQQLEAPANDVRLMRQVLLQRGFQPADIELLADGVEGAKLPTRAAILDALQALASRAGRGDTVYLHFAGHGSRQPVAGGATADGQPAPSQPIFLPRDVHGWDGKGDTRVPNALPDTLLRDAVDRLNTAGAFVFAVFDACHSARLVRGTLPGTDPARLRVRHVTPAALDIAAASGDAPPPAWSQAPQGAPTSGGTRGQAVYFYAAQSYEQATTLPLPSGGGGDWHGVFSWHIAQALALGQPMSYRQLAQHLLSRQDQLSAASVSPLFGGDGLDTAVFGESTPALRQWPLEMQGGRLMLPAGALSGVAEGALFAMLVDPLAPPGNGPTAPPRGTLGFLRAEAPESNHSLLEPVAWQGWAAPSTAKLPAGSWARLMINPPAFALRVAIEPERCAPPCPAAQALARFQRDGVPGVDLRWMADGAGADVRLRATPRGVRLLLPGEAAEAQEARGYAAPADDDPVGLETLVQQTAEGLHRVARARNLLQLAARQALRPPATGLELRLTRQRRDDKVETVVRPDELIELGIGDVLMLTGRNAGRDQVDLAVLWLGDNQGIHHVWPGDPRDTPRLAAGESMQPTGWRVAPGNEGIGHLVVLATRMRPRGETVDFRFLAQSPLSRLRAAADPELQALYDACFADYRSRGEKAPSTPSDELDMRAYTFRIAH